MLHNFRTKKWSELARGVFSWDNWSRNGKYVYVLDRREEIRVNIADHKLEHMLDLKDVPQVDPDWTGLAEDDSLLVRRDRSTQEIYALSLQLP